MQTGGQVECHSPVGRLAFGIFPILTSFHLQSRGVFNKTTEKETTNGCWSTLSLLRGTLLSRLGYPEHWLGFAQGLINGESVVDLQRRTGLCGLACKRWQVRFTQMLEQQGHTELVQWITWLRSRRVKQVSDFVRDGGQLEAVKGSRYSAESNRRFAIPPRHARKRNAVS